MKHVFALFLFTILCIGSPVWAAPPTTITYQGYLTDSKSALLNAPVAMTLSLYAAPTGGAPLWSEHQAAVSVINGSYSVLMGIVTPINLPFDAVYYLGVAINSDPEMTPRMELASVPYAFRATSADKLSQVCGDGEILKYSASSSSWSCAVATGTVGPAGPQGPIGLTGATGPQGPSGTAGAVGAQGQQGVPGPIGPQGPSGTAGVDGRTILNGAGTPVATGVGGAVGDFYIDTLNNQIYGPKTGADWTGITGVSMIIGPTGPQGPTGATGPQGPQGIPGTGISSITALSPLTGGTITTTGNIGLGTVPVTSGGTGLTSITAGSYLSGNGTGALIGKTPAQLKTDLSLTKNDLGLDNVANIKNNLAATGDPAVTDDTAAGYMIGSHWINTVTGKEFVCLDNLTGAAIWKELTNTGLLLSTNNLSDLSDTAAARSNLGITASNITSGSLPAAQLPQAPLFVGFNGTGGGSISSSNPVFSYTASFSRDITPGSTITLTATPDSNSTFAGWSGSCSGTGNCITTADASRTVAATFTAIPRTLTVTRTGVGTITSSPGGIYCGSSCSTTINGGSSVTLTATPDATTSFTGWGGGACTGISPCTISLSGSTNVTATFTTTAYNLAVTAVGAGSGTVTSNPAGIDCGSDCSETYSADTLIALNATPTASSSFSGWSGDCSGTGACLVKMSSARSVTASFSNAVSVATVAQGGTGSTTGSITGTGALTFSAGGTNTNVNLAPNGTGTVDVASKRITSLATPTATTDAATKAYVDASVASATSRTPLQIATLRWYDVNLSSLTFSAGANPYGIAFDGDNIWVSNSASNNVTKLTASTGAVVGTYAVGTTPKHLAFDGAYIWVVNSGSNNVTKLRASTGAAVGTYTVGTQPYGIAFDGTNIWVTNWDASSGTTVTQLLASTGAVVGTYTVGTGPMSIAFDGASIWVVNSTSNDVTKLSASTGSVAGTYPVGTAPKGIVFDGTNIWVANSSDNTVTKLIASTGVVVGTYSVGASPYCMAFDGTSIWVANWGPSSGTTVTKLLASTGAVVGTYTVGTGPVGIAFDGMNIWVTNNTGNTISKL